MSYTYEGLCQKTTCVPTLTISRLRMDRVLDGKVSSVRLTEISIPSLPTLNVEPTQQPFRSNLHGGVPSGLGPVANAPPPKEL